MAFTIEDVDESATAAIELLQEELAAPAPSTDVDRLLFFLSRWCRTAGIARLLGRGDAPAFRAALLRSADARLELLRRAARGGRPTRWACQAEWGPLCDALAAGADEAAAAVARASTQPFTEDEELLEDHAYGRVLAAMALPWAPASIAADLDAAEQAAGDEPPPRLLACRAIVARDPEAFGAALEALLDARADDLDRRVRGPSPRDEHHEADRFVSIEGLALVRLARRAGLATASDYRFVPGIALGP